MFSKIVKEEFDMMCRMLNLTAAGTIDFADTKTILGDIVIPESFKQQTRLISKVNLSGVCVVFILALMNRPRPDADSI
jgi:hypothetical protein